MPLFNASKHRQLIVAALFAMLLASCAIRCTPKTSKPQKMQPAQITMSQAASCINGTEAIAHIKKIITFGPRHPGTAGAEKTRNYIIKTLKGFGLAPKRHDFIAYTPHPKLKEIKMANITVDIAGATQGKTVLIGGHFDGKIIDSGFFAGANDGGSSTGLLLEIARCLAKHKLATTVRLAFFDGEEALVKWSDSDSLYGSKRMAADLKNSGEDKKIAAMVNVDMIGDKRLRLQQEKLSTPWVFATLKNTAYKLGYKTLFETRSTEIGDDHQPFLRIGIPSANLIDLRFGPGWTRNDYWHTPNDSIDKLSPTSIETIGQIVLDSLDKLSKGKLSHPKISH